MRNMKKLSKPIAKFKKPPYFRSGTLVFADSKHVLGISDRHYRCLRSSHRKCNVSGERQIMTETLERSFGRYAARFKIDKKSGQHMADTIMKKHLWELIIGTEEESERQEELMTATTEVMLQDGIANKKIEKSDVEDFENYFIRSSEADYPLLLCGFILNFIKMASHPEKEAALGRNLAILTKKVYLSKEGRILEIELEPWGWYTVNFIDRYKPNYLQALKKNGVHILNEPNEYLKMPIHEAALKYGIGYTQEAMGQDMNTMHGLFKFVKDIFSMTLKLEPEQMAVALPQMFNRIQNDPAIRIAVLGLGAMGIKPNQTNKRI